MGGPSGAAEQIQVFYDQLNATAGELDAAMKVADQVTSSHDALASLASAAGDSSVTSAIQSFLHTWSYGLSCMKSDAHTLSGNLRSAATRYQALEQALATAAHRGTGHTGHGRR